MQFRMKPPTLKATTRIVRCGHRLVGIIQGTQMQQNLVAMDSRWNTIDLEAFSINIFVKLKPSDC